MAVDMTRYLGREVATPDAGEGAAAPCLRRSTNTRDAIEDAAVELFARLGYHATTMRQIAAGGRRPARRRSTTGTRARRRSSSRLQDEFMERLTERVEAAIARAGPTPRCSSPAPSTPTSSTTASTRTRRSSPTREIRALTAERRARADRPARRLPGALRRADPRRHPRRLAAQLRRARRHLLDPAAVHGRRAVVPARRPARRRAGRRDPRRARARLARRERRT